MMITGLILTGERNLMLWFWICPAARGGGFARGALGWAIKKYGPFSWAAFWGVYCLLCIVVSAAAAWILAPQLWEVLFRNGGQDLLLPVFCGML